ncbi:hypothetical protein ABET52_12105, partial [Saccharococcus caldoxylosilyticus]|uniref:hypothetical protein n=1 Tax=Saccharococcus caldoxylosilyticus TaxID=81408 RepID=UPI003D3257FD
NFIHHLKFILILPLNLFFTMKMVENHQNFRGERDSSEKDRNDWLITFFIVRVTRELCSGSDGS